MAYVHILRCSDGSYYVGSTTDLERRLWEHMNRFYSGYTSSRLPVELVWSANFPTEHDAFLFERQVKGWSRAKKQALIRGEWEGIHAIVKQERRARLREKAAGNLVWARTLRLHSAALRSAQDDL